MKKGHWFWIVNDFGKVKWTMEHEAALMLIEQCAAKLEMTPGEFVMSFGAGERRCPECEPLN